MKNNSAYKTLNLMSKVGGATSLRNLYSPKALTPLGSLEQARKDLKKLLDLGYVSTRNIDTATRWQSYSNFYMITQKGLKYLGETNKYILRRPKGQQAMHDAGVVDIVLSFIRCFPDNYVRITYPDLNADIKYSPDAMIEIFKDGTTYTFLLEYERSREPHKIISEKVRKIDKIKSFEDINLPHMTRVLFVYSTSDYSNHLRPQEYNPDELQMENVKFDLLLKNAKGCGSRYLFTQFYNHYKVNEPIWYNSKKERTTLI